ncbi:MAG: hypothetical protein IPM32_07275 [Ignavibacteriae bacterium]|nr:hypothetical protein [Ignavibacteriota bacterium]
MKKIIIIITLTILIFQNSLSQLDTNSASNSIWGGFFNLGMQTSSVKKNVSIEQGFSNNFYGFSLGLGIFQNIFLAGINFSGDLPKDKKPFINNTTQGEKESQVQLTQLSFYGGIISPKLTFTEQSKIFFTGFFTLGNMWAFGEERYINGCIDCDEEELNVNGGIYLDPEIYFVYDFVGLGFGYKYFITGDYENKFRINLSLFLYE